MCKEKHMTDIYLLQKITRRLGRAILFGIAVFLPSSVLAADNVSLSTGNNSSIIERDPATGNRVMRTPEPAPPQEYQGPQTILVSPNVYPGSAPDPDGSPPPEVRPPHPGTKPPHPGRPLPPGVPPPHSGKPQPPGVRPPHPAVPLPHPVTPPPVRQGR